MEPEKSINYLLNQVFNAYRTNLEKLLKEIDLHSGQVFVLISLWSKNGRNQNEIAKDLNVSAPSVNKMIKSLEAAGFLFLRRNDADGRVTNVFLTEKGERIRGKVEEIWTALEKDIYSNLTETEKIVFYQLLDKTRENLLS